MNRYIGSINFLIFVNMSAVSSINLGSIVTFASCVIHRPLVCADVYPWNSCDSNVRMLSW